VKVTDNVCANSTKTNNKRFTFDPNDINMRKALEHSIEYEEPEDCDTRIKVFYGT
jgi:hypothetical protein